MCAWEQLTRLCATAQKEKMLSWSSESLCPSFARRSRQIDDDLPFRPLAAARRAPPQCSPFIRWLRDPTKRIAP